MLFHVAVTNFRKPFRSTLCVLRLLFVLPTSKVHVAFQPLVSQAHGAKKLPYFHSTLPRGVSRSAHTFARLSVGIRKCNEDKGTSALQLDDKSSKDHANADLSTRTTKPVPLSHLAVPIIPSTKWELYQEILRLVSRTPPAPISRLMSLHQRHPTLQSIESYNLLLQLSIRHSYFRHTRSLINAMGLNKIQPNSNTEKLVVRHLVTNGRWKQAWQQTATRYPSVADIPMPVLLELLAPGTRTFSNYVSLENANRIGTAGRTAFKIPLDTLIVILLRFPRLPLEELVRLPARIISYAVRGLIRNGHQDEAETLTEKHLKSLPAKLSPRRVDFARDLIHLHLSSGEVKLANYRKRRRLVEYYFSLHPSLSPNSHTVFLLMRYMERSKRCGIEAYLFFKDYRARWGATVESIEVRRRIVAYATKQRKFGIAKEISLAGPLEDPLPPYRQVVQGISDSLLRMRTWKTMYPRKGRRLKLWKSLLVRFRWRRRWKRLPKVPIQK